VAEAAKAEAEGRSIEAAAAAHSADEVPVAAAVAESTPAPEAGPVAAETAVGVEEVPAKPKRRKAGVAPAEPVAAEPAPPAGTGEVSP
jgi:hypothetical protein